jgi:4-hydroxyphenylpyruvate dioxygenase
MSNNPLGIRKFGPVTFYVKDSASEAKRLSHMLGMDITHIPENNSGVYVLNCNDATFILDGSDKAKKLATQYGNHVRDIGIYVNSANDTLKSVREKTNIESGLCEDTGRSFLKAPHDGEIYFTFLDQNSKLYPNIKAQNIKSSGPKPFQKIDHIVTNTQKIQPFIDFLKTVFGMEKVNQFTIRVQSDTFQASLYSEVMGLYGTEGEILFPINEPLAGDDESQIPAQLREAGRSHGQHIALATTNIIDSIKYLRSSGMDFLGFMSDAHSKKYYEDVPNRLGAITVKEAIDTLRSLGILVDKCGEGYLLQLFSKRLFPEKSVPFVEIIQRASDVIGCFGDGNFAALAESLEWSLRQENA